MIYTASLGATVQELVQLPEGYNVVKEKLILQGVLPDNYTIEDVAWKVWPNPPHETIIISMNVPAGGYALIDTVHFATECVNPPVPEPATMTLLALGLGAALLRRRMK